MMWKVFLLLALVASFSIVYCDDRSRSGSSASGSADVGTGRTSSDNSDAQTDSDSGANVTCNGDRNAKPGCGVNCGKTCSTYKLKNAVCPYACILNGCDCKDGFVYDDNLKKCVLPKDCSPICGLNEQFDSCAGFGCGYWNCSQIGQPELCIDPAPGGCKNGCRCIEGYLRTDNGTCVPQNQCPNVNGCNGDPNAQPGCGVNCGKTCSTYKQKNVPCPAICALNGCDCKDGYVYDEKVKKCVLPQQCSDVTPTNNQCPGPNEFLDTCISGCSKQKCSEIGKIINCPKQPAMCRTGCRCKKGFWRNDKNICVPKDKCPCGGDPNAKPGCGVNCGKTCATYKNKKPICTKICKVGGCDCKDGFVFDANLKKCVRPKDCTPICGKNERYDGCVGFGCGHRNCSQLGKPIMCRDPAPGACKSGCSCISGYLRAANGTCVPQDKCPAPACGGDPNAKPGCGVNCGKTCATYKNKKPICTKICKVGGCDCKDGFVFDANLKKCVRPKDCTPICGKNERYDGCVGFGCGHRNCSQLGKPIMCRDPAPGACKSGCSCISGYLRAANGTCVPQDKCPAPGCGGDPNAHKGCGFNCGNTCTTYKLSTRRKRLICPRIACKPLGCDCNKGYVFDANQKKCVLPKNCTPKCGRNEKYDPCTNGGCGHRNCSQIGQPQICIDRAESSCIKGCSCIDGYLRAKNGTCIPQDKCPATGCGGDPNAKPGCGFNCGRTCSTYKIKDRSLLCPRIQCKPNKCDCKDGFVFDNNLKKCVRPKQCTPVCGKNERYDGCVGFGCGPRNCSQLGKPILCIDPAPGACKSGCSCIDGYLRAANGTCIPKDKCPAPGCGGDPNARPGCGYNCGRTCSTYKIKNRSLLCPRIQCKADKCDCKDGFVFDNNLKKCVRPEQCTPICGLNEQYSACINGGCSQRNCSQLGQPQLCVNVVESACVGGCICSKGYLRANNGNCIPQDQCPKPTSCRGDPNAQPGCGNYCGKTCKTYLSKSVACPLICYLGGCDCKKGYIYDEAIKKCVLPSQCSDKTSSDDQCPGQNEFFDKCISGCGNQSCDSIGKIINCPIQPAVCRSGCRCKPGFYRNSDNVCVSESECPAPACPEGEIYSRCPTVRCEGDYCPKTRNSPLTCPVGIVCDPPRCVCGFNKKRDVKTGKCIPISSCPPFKCTGPNESYQACPPTCPGEKCSDYIYSTRCPPFRIGIVVPCMPKCRCNKGYYRNDKGICILGRKCGPKQTTSPVPIVTPITDAPVTPKIPGDNDDGGAVDARAELENLKSGVTSFNGKFLYDRMKSAGGENVVASPFSVFLLLAQLGLYTDGESLNQLTNVLNLRSKKAIRAAFPPLASSFDGQTSVNFSLAAKVYSNDKYPLNENFIKDSREVIRADAQALNFNAPAQAAATINSWVESQTNNRIKDLIQASDLSSLTRIVLVDAIYFKGQWEYMFDSNNTKVADFYLSDGSTKKTKLMYQEGNFNYGEVPDLGVTALEMFYKGRNFSMVFILPNEKDGIMKTAESLQDSANFNKVLGSLRRQKVKVYIPPYKINTNTDLADILKQNGVTKIFDPRDSGLSGMLKKPESVYVSKAIQKAFIEVTAEGAEAAAANGIIVGRPRPGLPPPPTPVFRADHPFLYYIKDKNIIFFCGSLNKGT